MLCGSALERIEKCKKLKELVITDSIPLDDAKKNIRIKVLSAAELFGEAIKRIHGEESVSSLFD